MPFAKSCTILCVGLLLMWPSPIQAETIKIWVRAFIPSQHPSLPGYMRPVPGAAGKTMIPSPIPLSNSCYNTNNRGFSSDLNADAKVSTQASIVLSNNQLQTTAFAPTTIGATIEYDCTTGKEMRAASAKADGVSVSPPAALGDEIKFDVHADVSNPLSPAPEALTPSIKWSGTFTINPRQGTVSFAGKVADFPSYEAYIAVDSGTPITLFQEPPAAGATALDLRSTHDLKATASYHSLDGTWESNDPGHRFELSKFGTVVSLVERNGGASISRSVTLASVSGSSGFRISRSNADPALLSFLGFAADIQTEMLKRNPQPSFIDLYFVDGALKGTWNGILVVKNMQGKFQDMRQPGTNPPKAFAFSRQ